MSLKRIFILTLSMFLVLWKVFAAGAEGGSSNPQVQQIDQQIQELEDMKRGFEARALRHENQAERLQFDDQAYLETRRHNQLAEENRAKAAAVQKEIDRLQSEKKKIQGG
jgi:hypothetical protein